MSTKWRAVSSTQGPGVAQFGGLIYSPPSLTGTPHARQLCNLSLGRPHELVPAIVEYVGFAGLVPRRTA